MFYTCHFCCVTLKDSILLTANPHVLQWALKSPNMTWAPLEHEVTVPSIFTHVRSRTFTTRYLDFWVGVRQKARDSYSTPLAMKEWFRAAADLDPFCIQEPFSDSERGATLRLRAWTTWLQSTHSGSRDGNTPLKDEFAHRPKFRRKHGNRAPACNSQRVFICAEAGARQAGRQAGLSLSLHFEKLLCFHAEGRALRVWRCCRVTASRAFPARPL